MITLFHSPRSRSTRIVALLKELDALDHVRIDAVTTARIDGSGGRDPRNPHPEGKVPVLDHDGTPVWESSAIVLHLADLFPAAALNIPIGHAQRGAYLSWFAWYSGVMEPIMTLEAAGLEHPFIAYTYRSGAAARARLTAVLSDSPFLLGDRFTAADHLLHSPFTWFGKPGEPVIDAWVDRCADRPGARFAAEFDEQHPAALSVGYGTPLGLPTGTAIARCSRRDAVVRAVGAVKKDADRPFDDVVHSVGDQQSRRSNDQNCNIERRSGSQRPERLAKDRYRDDLDQINGIGRVAQFDRKTPSLDSGTFARSIMAAAATTSVAGKPATQRRHMFSVQGSYAMQIRTANAAAHGQNGNGNTSRHRREPSVSRNAGRACTSPQPVVKMDRRWRSP